MNKRIYIAIMMSLALVYFSSCYNNKNDILSLPNVSFRGEVVPIVTGGNCGCHNNGVGTTAVQFSHLDTIFYDAILARVSLLRPWVYDSTGHPGGGAVFFTECQKEIIRAWIAQGAKDNYVAPPISGPVTYTLNILPIYNTVCKGSSCHGTVSPVLTYSLLLQDKNILTNMMNSGGSSGHPGGTISLTSTTINTFKAWLAQGQPL